MPALRTCTRPIEWELLLRQARQDARARFGALPDLEDLVQDALVLLLERQQVVEHPRAWLASAVWRLLANRRRSQRVRSPAPPATPWNAATGPSLEAELEIWTDMASAARRMSPCDRKLLELLAQGLTHREIADRLDIGWKSVGARVQRLRRKLHLLLEGSLSTRRDRT